MRFKIRFFIPIFAIIILLLAVREINLSIIRPNTREINLLFKTFGKLQIKNTNDLLKIQNSVINKIKHHNLNKREINIDTILKYQKGFCYDRSLILQKICLYNNIPIRPVYLYFRSDSTQPVLFDIFRKNLQSHNIFEVKWEGKWYMIQTNNSQDKMKTLEEYLSSGIAVPKNTKYIRHLNNRNGRLIAPSFIPDIY